MLMQRVYNPQRMRILALLLPLLAACPRPGLAPPTTGNAAARDRFETARARYAVGDYDAAARELARVMVDFPGDPAVPYAELYAGMTAFRQGDAAHATDVLGKLVADAATPDDVRKKAALYLGFAKVQGGDAAGGRALLEPLAPDDRDEDTERHASLAEADAALGDASAALGHYDAFFVRARPAERAYVTARVRALVDKVADAELEPTYGKLDKGRVSAAYLGRRLAMVYRAAGQDDKARVVWSETAAARSSAGIEGEERGGPVEGRLVGALLPLSGKRRLVGEAAQRGLALAAGAFGEGSLEVTLEDVGEAKGRAAEAVDALAARGVVGLVGPADKDSAEEAARRAEALGVPLVTLDVGEVPLAGTPHVFRVVVPVEARARALAAWALAKGRKRFAILAPDIPYGQRAAAAFRAEVQAGGGEIVADEKYPKDATSFIAPVAKIKDATFDALFVPDAAARLELVAPQLAVADLVVAPLGARKPRRGRPIVLLATAEAITPRFLKGSGRYTNGAVLAPGFYPDDADERTGSYVARFRNVFGEDPGYLDAYAYDAAMLLRQAVERGGEGRDTVAAWLGAVRGVAGLTGDIAFDAHGNRADRGVLYTVVDKGDGFSVIVLRR
jgi:ABC-type branched-subunit amino acid transport system substrate-binding protein